MNLANLNITPAALTLIVGLGAATLASLQAIVTLALGAWVNSRKDKRDAVRQIEANKAAALLKLQEKEEDWRRQDLVAQRVADAAASLLAAQTAAKVRTDEVARKVEAANNRIAEQLSVVIEGNQKIHTLVNSDMTAARTAERDAVLAQVLALRRMFALSERIGVPITVEETEATTVLEKRVVELNQILADRLAAQRIVDSVSHANAQLGTPAPE